LEEKNSFTISLPSLGGLWRKALDLTKKIDIWHIVLFGLVMRVLVLAMPSDGGMVFDEVHYIKASRDIIQWIAANAEHPPLVKLIVGFFMTTFGDYWFSWRIPIILFSMWIPYILYKIVMKLSNGDKGKALFTAFLSLFDIILFIHGNIYMLEMPSLVLALVSAYFLIDKKYKSSAIFMGLACLCNEKAVFALLGMGIYQLWITEKAPKSAPKVKFGSDIKKMGTFLIICSIIGFGGLWVSDLIWKPQINTSSTETSGVIIYVDGQGNPVSTTTSTTTIVSGDTITDPFTHLLFMFGYYTGLSNNIPQIASTWRPAWSWIGPWGPNWVNGPIYYSVSVSNGAKTYTPIEYVGETSFSIWWMTIPIFIVGILKTRTKEVKFAMAWILGTYTPWLLWDGIRQNIPFNHYFMFASIGCIIGIPLFWERVLPKYKYQAMAIHLLVTIIIFAYFFPIHFFR
jgi:hypothetical protein